MYSILQKVAVLKSVHLFSEMPNESLAALAMVLTEQEVPRGVDVLSKGTRGTNLFIIASGRVSVHDGLGTELAVLNAADSFGEFAALVSEIRMATVTTLENSVFFILEQAELFDVMVENRQVLQSIITTLIIRMRKLLQSAVEQHSSLAQLASSAAAERQELGNLGLMMPQGRTFTLVHS